ncbi:MAG: rod shape-determining protein [Candidatus Aureabacteria bacterium]|nr:rod shape-determining protein [Candidatus Auribacterota bacterium]
MPSKSSLTATVVFLTIKPTAVLEKRLTKDSQSSTIPLSFFKKGNSVFRSLLFGFFSNDMGIDLGTANTLVYVRGRGIIMNEPSVVAVEMGTDENILAVGEEAKNMLGRTPGNIKAVRPLRDGVIADFKITEAMLRYFIRKAHGRFLLQPRPRVVVGVPSEITPVEKRAVIESALKAGAREVALIIEPMAAAIGVGIPVLDPCGNMIIDIGGGTTDIAIISLGGIVVNKSTRVAGDKLTEYISHYLKYTYNLSIGERTSEIIKIQIGSAYPLKEEMIMEVKGRDLITGLPKTLAINSEEIRQAMSEGITAVVGAVRNTLDMCPPEIASDLVDKGVMLTGGGALLRGLDKLLEEKTGLKVIVSENPLISVAVGAGKVLEDEPLMKQVIPEKDRF